MLVRAQVAVAINHFLLYPGEVRDVPAGVVAQVLARRPGALVSVGEAECGSVGETGNGGVEETECGSVGETGNGGVEETECGGVGETGNVQELTEPKSARKRRAAR